MSASEASTTAAAAHNARRMHRADLVRRLVARLRNGEAVVAGIGNTNFDLWAAGHRAQNFYMLGSMGLAVPIALGVALAQPDRKVFALEGDGSLLMQLGCLCTVAALSPPNLSVLLFDNGTYQITGGQPTPAAAAGADLVAVARGCGLPNAAWAADEADFERTLDHCLAADGPHVVGLKLDDQPPAGQTERDPAQIRDRFMRGLGAKRSLLPG
jgi:thiamine pyrophosphate-dependent acetolactate synthase large subunit-like protein